MKHSFLHAAGAATVQTRLGAIQGYEHNGLKIFKGIPYAKAARFHAPEEPDPWEGVMDACSYGYVCPLMTNDRPRGELYVPHRFWPMDEDCMNLNIWTPGLDDGKRPVLVWLHGGGYEAGSSIEQIAYDGANMSRLGNAVVVSVNHRLNVLGYFDVSDFGEEYANSGNAGGDDIVAALRWIHENIPLFGGDPARVTVFGQSGGGAKVTTLLQTPAADGLYSGGIVMSGVIGPVLADADGSGKELAEAIMKELGLKGIRELEKVEYAALARAYLKLRPDFARAGKYTGGRPHPNKYYAGDPLRVGFRKETAMIPLIIGSVFGEFTSFGPIPFDREGSTEEKQAEAVRVLWGADIADALIPLFKEAYPERKLYDLTRLDYIFRQPEIRYIAERSKLNDCTWSYLFNLDQPIDGGNTPWHCCDIPYVFHNLELVEYPHGPATDPGAAGRVQEEIFSAFLAFAEKGDPANGKIPYWPACKPGNENVLMIDGATRVATNPDHRLMRACEPLAEEMAKRLFSRDNNIQH